MDSPSLFKIMAYCTVEDIKSEFKSINFTSTTDEGISTDDVSEFIDQEGSYIDSKISLKYKTPVESPVYALSVLKKINVLLVTCRIKKILRVKTGENTTSQDSVQKNINDCQLAEKMLDDILKNKINLSAKKPTDLSISKLSYNDQTLGPFFKKDVDQW